MELRASARSCLRCSSASMDEHQVADVDDEPRGLPHDEHRVASVNCVRGGDRAADDGEIPELDGDVALPPSLGGDPLHDEPRREDELPGEADEDPEVPGARVETHDGVSASLGLAVAGWLCPPAREPPRLRNLLISPRESCNSTSGAPSTAPPGNPPTHGKRDSWHRTLIRRSGARGG